MADHGSYNITTYIDKGKGEKEKKKEKGKSVISQTLKHVRDMFNFNMTSNPRGYLVLFVSKTPLVVWYFIMDLIPPKVCGYFALFESKSAVIFICIHCLIISFKLRKFTQILHGVFPSSSLKLTLNLRCQW